MDSSALPQDVLWSRFASAAFNQTRWPHGGADGDGIGIELALLESTISIASGAWWQEATLILTRPKHPAVPVDTLRWEHTPRSLRALRLSHISRDEGDRVNESAWQWRRRQEESVRSNHRATGPVEDLLACPTKRFEAIVCNRLPVSFDRYYEYLFSCIALTVFGDQFTPADAHAQATELWDAAIVGVKCGFTMEQSVNRKRARDGIVLISFPHKSHHKGCRPKREMAEIVVDTVIAAGVPATVDQVALATLTRRLAAYAY